MLDGLVGIYCEFELFGELSDLCGRAFEIEREGRTRFSAEDDVFGHGHRLDQHEVLVDHADAERDCIMRRTDVAHLALNYDLTGIGSIETVSDTHRRRLARAVLAHDGMDRSRLYDDVDMIVGQNIAEALSYL